MYHMRNFLNQLKGGKRIGRVTIWFKGRQPRYRFEDFRRYGGNAISLTLSARPDHHSWANVMIYVRVK